MRSRITQAWRRLTARTGAAERLDSVAPATWCLDHATMAGDRLRLSGWAILATDVPVSFAINGRPCEHQRWTPRPDVAALYPFVPKRGDCGFEAEARLTDTERDGADVVKVDLVDRGTGLPLREEQAFYVPGAAAERWPLPDAARRRRVHGTEDEQSFRILGYSNRHKLEWALRNATGAGFAGRVLDWGCGCGRLLRYCGEIAGASFTGADIDPDNLRWCRSHLPMAGYELIPLHPPTPFPDHAFDIVIGVSVFTHLTEPVQHEWLEELRRIVAPGGTVMLTIHGPAAAAISGRRVWEAVSRRGFVDHRSHDLDDVLDETEYYRTAFHSHDYVRRTWSRYFELLALVPAAIGNMQDLVVLRARR